jgi:glucose/arabinose dehydrogenase
MLSRASKLLSAWIAACGWAGGTVAVADGARLPHSTSGHKVILVASGLQTPTSFAFGVGNVFVSDFGSQNGDTAGGVYVLRHGSARRLVGSPQHVFGLAWRSGTLYVSAGSDLLAWGGWNGSRFTRIRTIYSAPTGFTGFNGLGFGADGRLYAGVGLGEVNDHSPTSAPYAFDVLSLNTAGKDLKVVARGLRQPFQLAFPAGSSSPFVSDLGQDLPAGIAPPDYLVRVHRGDNYGFPRCNWLVKNACDGFAKPIKFLPPHASPMGLGIIGNRLYIALFVGLPNQSPAVVSMPLGGGGVRTVLAGFTQPIVGLNTHSGSLYVGELAGSGETNGKVFVVKP